MSLPGLPGGGRPAGREGSTRCPSQPGLAAPQAPCPGVCRPSPRPVLRTPAPGGAPRARGGSCWGRRPVFPAGGGGVSHTTWGIRPHSRGPTVAVHSSPPYTSGQGRRMGCKPCGKCCWVSRPQPPDSRFRAPGTRAPSSTPFLWCSAEPCSGSAWANPVRPEKVGMRPGCRTSLPRVGGGDPREHWVSCQDFCP